MINRLLAAAITRDHSTRAHKNIIIRMVVPGGRPVNVCAAAAAAVVNTLVVYVYRVVSTRFGYASPRAVSLSYDRNGHKPEVLRQA